MKVATARFHVDDPLQPSDVGREVPLPDDVAHHALRVLRLVDGDEVVLFDGRGGEYRARLSIAGRRDARVRLERFDPVERETPVPLVLVQAVLAAEPMEFVVRKSVELGVASILPVLAARSQGSAALGKRVLHWRAVAVSACEQCGRNRVPELAEPVPLLEWLHAGPETLDDALMLDPESAQSLPSAVREIAPRRLLVGPEGGWTGEEREAARARGVNLAHLGPRVLRAETAAIAAVAIVNALSGDDELALPGVAPLCESQ